MATGSATLAKTGKFGDLRRRLVFLLLALVVYRIGTHIPVPGIDPAQIDVTIDRGVMTISGERPSARPGDDARVNVYANERFAGRFRRAVSLPDDIDPSKVEATYRDGVLRVSVARRESALPKRITVQ